MLAASTTYHRWVNEFRKRAAWRRADHAMIFAAMGGSATPVVLIVMPSGWGIALLAVVWAVAIFGAVLKFGHWHRGDFIGSAMIPAVSALGALALPALWIRGGVTPAILFVLSGSLYIFGAYWFSRTWPRLRPAVFSWAGASCGNVWWAARHAGRPRCVWVCIRFRYAPVNQEA